MGDCIISMGEIIPPNMSGGNMLAVPQNIALIQELATEVAGAIQGVGEFIGSTPITIGTTAIQGVESLFDCMARATRENVVPFYAEGSPDYLEKCIKLTTLVDEPIESISDVTTIIHKVPLTSENKLIKEFNIIKNHYGHMFSTDHTGKGIINLGTDRSNIIEKFTNIVLDLDRQGLLVEKGVQIETIIDSIETTIRIYVINGKVGSFNGFAGFSNDVLGKLIKYTYRGT